ncbi:MAG: type II toxin-antitoxin system RelE/ParE family toxin [Burkholderiales bacterium]
MIKSFRCKETEKIYKRQFSKRFPREIQQRAFQKLNALDAAEQVQDLRLPPSNRLEALKADRKGQWSIRINDQCGFALIGAKAIAEQVEIVDYH